MEPLDRPPVIRRMSRFAFACSPELRERIMVEAIRQGMSGAVFVRSLVKRHLDAVDAKRAQA